MRSWIELPCVSVVLEFFWAEDVSCLRHMALAVGVLKVVNRHWRAIAEKSLEAWSRTHSPLSVALDAIALPSFVPCLKNDACVVWPTHKLPIRRTLLKCCLKCCRKRVGQLVPVCPRTGGTWASTFFPNALPNIYGDSDYVHPASRVGNARHEMSYHRDTIHEAMRAMYQPVRDVHAWKRRDLTGYLCPARSGEAQASQSTWKVKGISVACSKECYKVLKLMTRDPSTAGFRARHGLQHISREFWHDGLYLCLRGVDAFDFLGGSSDSASSDSSDSASSDSSSSDNASHRQ